MSDERRRGFTLIESVVTVGILLGLTSLAILPWQLAREQTQAAANTIRTVLDETRTAAKNNNGSGSGAILVIESGSGETTSLRILLNRPLPNFDAPIAPPNAPPVTVPMPVTIESGSGGGFSIAISPSGQIDIIKSVVAPGAGAISAAPGCGDAAKQSLQLTIGTGIRAAHMILNCADGSVID